MAAGVLNLHLLAILVQQFSEMCGQKLVHYAARRRIEDLDSSLTVAEDNSMLTHP